MKLPFKGEKQNPGVAGFQGLMPVILATWEAELRRLAIAGQSRQNVGDIAPQPRVGCGGTHLSSHAMKKGSEGSLKIRRIVIPG
jgi:hypothetical protein